MAASTPLKSSLVQLSVTVPSSWEEPAGALLEAHFAQWPAAYAAADAEVSDLSLFLPAEQRPSRAQLAELEAQLLTLPTLGLPSGSVRLRVTALRNRDWRESWKRHFKAFEVGRQLLVRPSWSRRKPKPGQSVLILDPGLSFGTGQHPTTRFCLQELARARRKQTKLSLLDIGTGSGILAIAAAKLGYLPIHAFDLDPDAIRVARSNARRNRTQQRILFRAANLTSLPSRSRQRWNVVCANLLADLLMQEADRILNRVTPGGTLVVAGILAREFDDVERVYVGKGARLIRTTTEREWRSASFCTPC